jgi:hypothetical protein
MLASERDEFMITGRGAGEKREQRAESRKQERQGDRKQETGNR